jgi:hypothetical protein
MIEVVIYRLNKSSNRQMTSNSRVDQEIGGVCTLSLKYMMCSEVVSIELVKKFFDML